MPPTKDDLTKLEQMVSEPSRAAFRNAYRQVLATGAPTVILDDGDFIQFAMEGERCVVRRLEKGERPRLRVASAPVIKDIEDEVPELARQAIAEAYARAIASGHPITITIGDELVEVTADGQHHVVGKVPPATHYASAIWRTAE